MTQVNGVREQLWSQGIHHFVILSSSGTVYQSSGDFTTPQKQRVAAALLQQIPYALRDGEKFQRISMTFDNVVYVATLLSGEKEDDALGVVVKYPITPNNVGDGQE